MLVESTTLIVRDVIRSTGSSVPSTVTPSTDEVPVSCGAPPTHLPVASARSARRFTRSPLNVGSSDWTAARMSIVPTPGISCEPGSPLRSGGGIGIGRPAIRSSPRPAPALAVWAVAEPVGGWRSVVALSRLPVIGSGEGGALPPADSALQLDASLLAVIGSMRGDGPRVAATALDSQVQPWAKAGAVLARKAIRRISAKRGGVARRGTA
jgi:hypothetical protein